MPCRDDGQAAYYDGIRIKEQKDKIDLLTRLLCEAITAHPSVADTSPAHRSWWDAHQEADRARLKREAQEETEREQQRLARVAALEAELATLKKKP